jgi:cytochrome c2
MKTIFASILFAGCMACTTKLYIPGEANVNKVEPASLIELQQGHDLFQNKCGKCHKLPKPDKYSNPQWTKILLKMALKAKINSDQSDLIYKYIVNR